jgi:Fe-S cluster assembly protein SufD
VSGAALEADVFRAAFERRSAERHEPAWLHALREEAFAAYSATGLPTTRDEDWRFTSVQPIARTPFAAPSRFDAGEAELQGAGFVELPGARLVFVNGRFHPLLSRVPDGAGARAESLGAALQHADGRIAGAIGRQAKAGTPFTALNTALFEDGAVVEISPGARPAEPIHLVFYGAEGAEPAALHTRVLLLAGAGSQATVVESHLGNGVYFANAATEIRLEDGAQLDHVKLQRESEQAFHVAALAASLGRDARLTQHHLALGARLSRAEIEARFDAPGGECALLGLFHADGERLADSHTRLHHAEPAATSRELYKGILDGRARGVFHGRIVVGRDAQKTSAHQTNRNLLLSREALVQSTPQLEIFADDVKCKHGSTTGQLDEAALFYLRSRGLDATQARSLLTYAFASDVIRALPRPELRAAVTAHLHGRLGGGREVREAAL